MISIKYLYGDIEYTVTYTNLVALLVTVGINFRVIAYRWYLKPWEQAEKRVMPRIKCWDATTFRRCCKIEKSSQGVRENLGDCGIVRNK